MNLIDAIKSGRLYRAIGETEWRTPFVEDDIVLSRRALLDDYEIQEPTVTITRAQFHEAFATALANAMNNRGLVPGIGDAFGRDLAQRLGLGDAP